MSYHLYFLWYLIGGNIKKNRQNSKGKMSNCHESFYLILFYKLFILQRHSVHDEII
jgi:hypothetical protein